jgi:AcrR family transcriptional regulator
MEAAASRQAIEGDKARRIVDAMRSSVARRGVAGSTFDHVARDAGVSRGLLHYYFGTKERLLAEVVRRDCELRMGALDRRIAPALSAEDVINQLIASLQKFVDEAPELILVVFELFTVSRRNDEIAAEFAELLRRIREHVAQLLAEKQREGVLRLRADPEAVSDVLFALGDGIALRMLTQRDRDFGPTLDACAKALRALID